MKSFDDFNSTITEIDFLNSKIDGSPNDRIIFKTIILLLCAKLETYVKSSADEYAERVSDLKLTTKKFPKLFLYNIIDEELTFAATCGAEKYISLFSERAKILSSVWDQNYVIDLRYFDTFSHSITSNGTNAINDAYKKIGFPDVVKNLADYKIPGMFSSTAYPVKYYIDKIVNIRHKIIHDNATPGLTKNDITLFVNISKNFVSQIDKMLEQHIELLS